MKKSFFLLAFTFSSCFLIAQEKKEEIKPIPEAKSFVTTHQINSNGKLIKFKATAKETYLKNNEGDSVASLWSVAYTQTNSGDVSKRPVTFVFNGGPGSASVWLHMGMFGPKIVKVNSDAQVDDGAAPYPLVTNNNSLLDITDLVFDFLF